MDHPSQNARSSEAKKRSSQQWEIKPSLPHQTRVLDFIRRKACLTPEEGRPQRMEKVVNAINSELRKMQGLLKSSCFQDSLKDDITNQINTYVQQVDKSCKQATRYNGYMGSQGKSDREQGEVKLRELLSDIEQKVEAIGELNKLMKELKIKNIDDLNKKIANQYKEFNSILISKLDKKSNKMVIELFLYKKKIQNIYHKFIQSCSHKSFFEVAKLAKQFIAEKEAFESYLFRSHFLSLIKGQELSQSEQDQLAKIDRKTSISKVPEKWQMPFAIARGHAITEKVSRLPDGDINTEKNFDSRYENNINKIKKGLFKVLTWVKTQRISRYINCIDIKNGIITANHNFRDYDAEDGGGKPLPNSEILYHQLLAVL